MDKKEDTFQYKFFRYFSDEYDLTLLDGEINDIKHFVNKSLSQQVTKLEAERDELLEKNKKMNNMLFSISGILEPKTDHDSELMKTYIKVVTPKN